MARVNMWLPGHFRIETRLLSGRFKEVQGELAIAKRRDCLGVMARSRVNVYLAMTASMTSGSTCRGNWL